MNKKIFSLIVATINRKKEVEEFLESIKFGNFPLDKIEIIIIDQNKEIDLSEIIKKAKKELEIIHIKSKIKGISKNRNLGIKKASGNIICFPDDDCKYVQDTLIKVVEEFDNNPKLEGVIGRIIDENKNDCIKKWSKTKNEVKRKNFIKFNSMITIFIKNKKKYFDERFGPGEKYPSAEDADYLYELLLDGKNIIYTPEVIVFHPNGMENFDKKKAYNYGLGFGAFCKKYSDFYTLKIFLLGTSLALLRTIWNSVKLDNYKKEIWFSSFKGRIIGFLKN